MIIERYCTCGAVLRVTVPREKRQQVLGNWFEKHGGVGHAPATRQQAYHAQKEMRP